MWTKVFRGKIDASSRLRLRVGKGGSHGAQDCSGQLIGTVMFQIEKDPNQSTQIALLHSKKMYSVAFENSLGKSRAQLDEPRSLPHRDVFLVFAFRISIANVPGIDQ